MDVKSVSGAPYFYDYINAQTSTISPSTIHISNSGLAKFFQRYLIQKAMSRFKFTLPENWDKDYFLYSLFLWGYEAVLKTDKFGVIPQQCGLYGYNVFYRPTHAVISNPLLKGVVRPQIGVQCELVKLMPDYGGMWDSVEFHGNMMALCAETAGTNLLNSKLAFLFAAKNKTFAESFKKLYDNFASGEPLLVVDRNLFDENGELNVEMFHNDVRNNFIAPEILENLRKWEERFCTEWGIPVTNTEKKERLVSGEVEANRVESETRMELILEELQESFERVRQMFGYSADELNVEWREEVKNAGYNERIGIVRV